MCSMPPSRQDMASRLSRHMRSARSQAALRDFAVTQNAIHAVANQRDKGRGRSCSASLRLINGNAFVDNLANVAVLPTMSDLLGRGKQVDCGKVQAHVVALCLRRRLLPIAALLLTSCLRFATVISIRCRSRSRIMRLH